MLNTNLPKINLVHKTRKATVETILKQVEYVTKGHKATYTTLFLNLKQLYLLLPFSSLVLALTIFYITL